ncbi:MAG: diaminopimelate decarboxylase [Pseudomonadota bacterium]
MNTHFTYRNGQLHAEDVALSAIAAAVGTPVYVYSRAAIEQRYTAFDRAWGDYPHLVCYAVKANSNLAILNILARQGAGFDIVSGGELRRVLAAGGDARKVIFSGVGKSVVEIEEALRLDIQCFNVESQAELERIDEIAGRIGKIAPVALRVNPDVDAKTHPYISTGLKQNKFGIDIQAAYDVYRQAARMKHVKVAGIACHIGSQLTDLSPFIAAMQRVLDLIDRLAKVDIVLEHLDIGGGLGIRYRDEDAPSPEDYVAAMRRCVADRKLIMHNEPGRAIVGNAGVLVTRVEYLKHHVEKNFAVIDAAMNDLIRPSLYGAWQDIVPVVQRSGAPVQVYDVVGPVCETGDFLGKDRALAIAQGDLLAVYSAGAYGFAMSSNYNTRPRVPEVLVDGAQYHIVRRRETVEELYALESMLPR